MIATLSTVYAIFLLAITQPLKVCCGNEIQANVPTSKNKFEVIRQSNGLFSTNLLRALSTNNENVLISPQCLHYALTTLLLGSSGETHTQLKDVLHLPDDENKVKSSFKQFMELLKVDKNVKMATGFFVDKRFPVREDYENDLVSYFDSSIEELNFSKQPEESRSVINTFVANKTDNLIKDMFEQGSISVDTIAVLISAIHFKAQWLHPFDDSRTSKRTFYGVDKHYETDIMHLPETSLRYKNDTELNAQLLEVPYEGGYKFLIILPKEKNGLAEVEKKLESNVNLNSSSFIEAFQETREVMVTLYLPKFKFEQTHKLKDVLQKMGLGSIFSDTADFGRLTSVPIKINDVIQKTFIDVNEKTTKAAAATGIEFVARSSRLLKHVVKADHPFLYAIVHESSNTPLFMGKFFKP